MYLLFTTTYKISPDSSLLISAGELNLYMKKYMKLIQKISLSSETKNQNICKIASFISVTVKLLQSIKSLLSNHMNNSFGRIFRNIKKIQLRSVSSYYYFNKTVHQLISKIIFNLHKTLQLIYS